MQVALLYRFDQAEFIELLKQLAGDVVCQLVKRFTERGLSTQATHNSIFKLLWLKSLKIAEFTSKSLLMHALVVKPPSSIMIQFMAIHLFDLQNCLGRNEEHFVSFLQAMMDVNNFLASKHNEPRHHEFRD